MNKLTYITEQCLRARTIQPPIQSDEHATYIADGIERLRT